MEFISECQQRCELRAIWHESDIVGITVCRQSNNRAYRNDISSQSKTRIIVVLADTHNLDDNRVRSINRM